ncbi:DUF5610 domain-containing protein [Thalassolituus sp. LLYu03]|uniref:DUF5610 domain-containing protein n=1 Tax=Thalassolituus sp. LLYu03 TaxID=3421656 RepID=UPI003D2BC611
MSVSIPPGWYNSRLSGGYNPLSSGHKASPTVSAQTQESGKTEQAQASSGAVSLGPKQSPQDTAANILKHVTRGLDELAASGASQERLLQRLDAARAGIEKGYQEATAMLDDMGMLDDDLNASIADGRSLVDAALDDMENRIRNPEAASSSVVSSRASVSASNTLSLQVLTRDGDRVEVSFSQSADQSLQSSAGNMRFTANNQQSWNMQVSGSLSDAEKTALEGLFGDVQSLSEQFFGGDIGSALQSAMSLGFDGSQLASMSLSLTQQSVISTSRAYAPAPVELPTPELESLKAPLALYAEQYTSALEKAGALAEPHNVFRDLVEQMLPQDERLSVWEEFHAGLNQAAGLFV